MGVPYAKTLVRHLRFLYQDLILFGVVLAVTHWGSFSHGQQIGLIFLAWGASLWIREEDFQLFPLCRESIKRWWKAMENRSHHGKEK